MSTASDALTGLDLSIAENALSAIAPLIEALIGGTQLKQVILALANELETENPSIVNLGPIHAHWRQLPVEARRWIITQLTGLAPTAALPTTSITTAVQQLAAVATASAAAAQPAAPTTGSQAFTTGPDSMQVEGYAKGSGPYAIAWPDPSKPNEGAGTIDGLPIIGTINAPDGPRYMLDKTGANSGDIANQIQGPLLADVTNNPPA